MAKIRKQNSALDLLGKDIPELNNDSLLELYKNDVLQDDDSDVIAIFSCETKKEEALKDDGEEDLINFIKTNRESSVYDNIWDTDSSIEETAENKEPEVPLMEEPSEEESSELIGELERLFDDTSVKEEIGESVQNPAAENAQETVISEKEEIVENPDIKEESAAETADETDVPLTTKETEPAETEPLELLKQTEKTESAPIETVTETEDDYRGEEVIEEEIPFTSTDDLVLSLLEEKEEVKEITEEPVIEENRTEKDTLPSDLLPPPVFDIKSEIEMIEAESFDMSEETLDILEKPSLSDVRVKIPEPIAKEEKKPSAPIKEELKEQLPIRKKKGMDFLSVIGIICAIAALAVFGFAGTLFFGADNTPLQDKIDEPVIEDAEESVVKPGGETAYAYLDESQNKTLREWQKISSDVDRVIKIYGREYPLVYDGMKEYYAQRDIYRNFDPAGTPSIYKGAQYVVRTGYLQSDEDLMFDFIPNYLDTSIYRKFPLISLVSENSTDYFLIVALVDIKEGDSWYMGECDPNEYVQYVQDNAAFIFSPEIDTESRYINIIADGLGQMLVAKLV